MARRPNVEPTKTAGAKPWRPGRRKCAEGDLTSTVCNLWAGSADHINNVCATRAVAALAGSRHRRFAAKRDGLPTLTGLSAERLAAGARRPPGRPGALVSF